MPLETIGPESSNPVDGAALRDLHQRLLDSWNRRNASDYAAVFEEESYLIGFDGSQINGQAEIESHIRQIFEDHQTAAYVGKVRGVRFLTPDVAILRAVVGMVPPGKTNLNPATNAVQTVVATRRDGQWGIVLFQNTPAQFHGRPELSEALTEELQQLL